MNSGSNLLYVAIVCGIIAVLYGIITSRQVLASPPVGSLVGARLAGRRFPRGARLAGRRFPRGARTRFPRFPIDRRLAPSSVDVEASVVARRASWMPHPRHVVGNSILYPHSLALPPSAMDSGVLDLWICLSSVFSITDGLRICFRL